MKIYVTVDTVYGRTDTALYRGDRLIYTTSGPSGSSYTDQNTRFAHAKDIASLAAEFQTPSVKNAMVKLGKSVRGLLPGNTLPNNAVAFDLAACAVCGGVKYGLVGLLAWAAIDCSIITDGAGNKVCGTAFAVAVTFIDNNIDCGTATFCGY